MRFCQLILLFILAMPAKANELMCMAKNIYFESRGEPEAGQFMVGFITMNRVRDKRWPNTICKVVYQDAQFSWTQDKHSNKVNFSSEVFKRIVYIASIVMQSREIRHYGFYFKRSDYNSYYFRKLRKVLEIGNHEFYK